MSDDARGQDAGGRRRLVIGLTGGIGSGKSAVADLFADLGAAIVDTDLIAHDLTGPAGKAMPAIERAFGPDVVAPDGSLDRRRMRELAFSSSSNRERLEAILHPLIRQISSELVAHADGAYVILVVPLLVESGTYRDRVDRVLVVDCATETQIARTMARSGLTREATERIIAAQATRARRLAAADDVIDNEGPRPALAPQVEALHEKYLALAAQARAGH